VLADETTIEREVMAPGDVWFMRRIFPYLAHDSKVEGVVITFADITERKAINSALEAAKLEAERANAAKSRFLAAASHDLRQPLQALTLLKELLGQIVTGERAIDLLSRFDQTLRALSGMLDVLLNINQIEAGAVMPKVAIFPVNEVLDRLRDEFAYMAQARNLALHILPSEAWVESDLRLLEQIIRNLLGNAVKYTHAGKILLGCRRRGTDIRIEVWDTGIGIEADQLHAIFDEFHQIDNAARERSLGLGLGLSIVQRLGHLLRHDIDVRSVPGKGSVFAITVPSRQNAPAPLLVAAAPADLRAAIPHPGAEIVIVEDDPDLLDLLTQLLRAQGHVVRCATDAASAIKLITAGAVRPEILLTDYNLPAGQSGIDLLSTLRGLLRQELPAIILTGDISSDALAHISRRDCLLLSKPVEPQELILAIERLCPRRLALPASSLSEAEAQATPVTYVIDDEPQIRTAMRELLVGYGRAVEDFDSAETFLAAYRPGEAGCLLVDAHLPGMSGIELLGTLRARGDHMPVILITGDGDVGLAVDAMRAGACEFIEKPVGRIELLASIDRATHQSHDLRLKDAAQSDAASRVAGLTARQREVMGMVLAGHPSKNIAADLGISQRTVENHRAEIMHRMGVKSIPELARKVLVAEV
jgi:two-component system CheB/CheR fusion protein